MTATATMTACHNDADLVAASRLGDRSAFGQIVSRYQAMIAGLAYANCGNLHQSEDIAQETFVSAWKSLSGLRDPSKLPGWLCQIARRRLSDLLRKSSTSEIPFSQAFETGEPPTAAETQASSAEEAELLWRTLSKIAQPYRETLVLYYRQERSVTQVAVAMDTTEAAVRQRLVRGREMLREELAVSIERQLTRTAPRQQFTLQVVAALPAIPIVAAQTGGVAATAKGAALAKTSGATAILLSWLAPLGCLFALVFGTVQDARNARSPRQRAFAIFLGVAQFAIIAPMVVAYHYLPGFARRGDWPFSAVFTCYAVGTCAFAAVFFTLIAWGRWHMDKILREVNSTEPPFPTIPIWQRLIFTAPVVTIFLGWMLQPAMKAQDHIAVSIISALIVGQSLWYAWRLPQLQPDRTIQQTFETLSLALISIVVILNWRFELWLPQNEQGISLWPLNLSAAILLIWMAVPAAWDYSSRSKPRYAPSPV
jgi:RNA polymerase sigma factor (sigma-70 family)